MSTEPHDARRGRVALRIGVLFTFLFALTWALPAFFNWIFFLAGSYSFFLYWFYQPRTNSFERTQGYDYNSASPAERFEQQFKRVARIIGLAAAGLIVLFFIANILSRSSQTVLPDVEVERSENVEADDLTTWAQTGYDFYLNKQYDSALYYYERMLQRESNNGQAWYNKGLVYYEQQKADEAFSAFSRAYDAGIRDAFLSHVLAYLNDNKGNTSRAVDLYKEAVSMDSSRSDIYARLAELEPERAARYKVLEERWKN
jgi:tetratricopeptide (TPR) repeat protein